MPRLITHSFAVGYVLLVALCASLLPLSAWAWLLVATALVGVVWVTRSGSGAHRSASRAVPATVTGLTLWHLTGADPALNISLLTVATWTLCALIVVGAWASSRNDAQDEFNWPALGLVIFIAGVLILSGDRGSGLRTRDAILQNTSLSMHDASLITGIFRKVVHALAYFGAAWLSASALVRAGWPLRTAVLVAGVVTLSIAGLDELRQSRSLERKGTVADIALDAAGASLALLLFAVRQNRRQSEASL